MKWKISREDNYREKKMTTETQDSTSGVMESESSTTAARDRKKTEDLNSGMELLELDFLLSIVESTAGNDSNDVAMRKLTFNELLRRKNQNHIDSQALTVYAVNPGNLYGKDIQCEAMMELTKRTAKQNEHNG